MNISAARQTKRSTFAVIELIIIPESPEVGLEMTSDLGSVMIVSVAISPDLFCVLEISFPYERTKLN